ncbi:metallophosphoesterase family protein [Ornithinibacillus halotolerans]|uniref:Serine/threonine protein phosphatase n=1 Tax=Ornithinibacillus halotolerans TaxID=1274357 RepID=A0A916RS43_9BACI|nr:metallophosphoesterase family protein [Ornithinibacillus halotolerans]GGA67563.1 serine/threonine protein phosphatase [Ornithinibacillus halotolerans]
MLTKIAIISDIHGNLTALESVLADIEKRGVDKIYCLGDLVGKGPRGSACIELVKKYCDKVIRGNWDVFIQDETDNEHLKWIQSQLTTEDFDYLASLPFHIEFELNGKLIRCFHASPRSEFERIAPEYYDKEKCLSLFENSEETNSLHTTRTPDYVFYGDIHVTWLRHYYETGFLINVGSVGLDLVEATYVLIDGSHGAISTNFVRVPYDREAELRAAKDLGMASYEEYEKEIMYEIGK